MSVKYAKPCFAEDRYSEKVGFGLLTPPLASKPSIPPALVPRIANAETINPFYERDTSLPCEAEIKKNSGY